MGDARRDEPTIETLALRLGGASAGARRVAALDVRRQLVRGSIAGAALDRAWGALTDRLAVERDEGALLALIRALRAGAEAGSVASDGGRSARAGLARLRDDAAWWPRVGHAALLAHDAIEYAARAGPARVVEERSARAARGWADPTLGLMSPSATTADPATTPDAPAGGVGPGRHLLGLAGMDRSTMVSLLRASARMLSAVDGAETQRARAALGRPLAGRMVAMMFFEASTRTRVSFEIAARRLGADCVNASGDGGAASSVSKGETLLDTARTVDAMGVDALVVRATPTGAASSVAGAVKASLINAGDGRREHPTQGLLDALALAEALGVGGAEGSFDLSGRRVVIAGDIINSRVARSDVHAFTTLGARVTLVGPSALAPKALETLAPGVEVSDDFEGALTSDGGAAALQMLRVQFERSATIASAREYRAGFGLTTARAARLAARRDGGPLVMHPGPANRGLEIDGGVLDGVDGGAGGLRSLVARQVTAGVAVRMAVLSALLGGGAGGSAG